MVKAQRHRPPELEFVEGRRRAVDQQVAAVVVHHHGADGLRCLDLHLFQQRHRHPQHVELAGDKGERAGPGIRDDRRFDTVEIGPTGLPVIRVLHHLDAFVRLEFEEFERPGADRMLAHLRRRHMAGIDRRQPGGEQRDQVGLRPLQMKGDLIVAVGGDLLDIAVPRFARVDAELVGRALQQRVPGAFDVTRGERLAIMPFDSLTQWEGQLRPVLVPRPAGRQIGHDRGEAVLCDLLVEDDEVVEHAHHRDADGDRRFLVDRHARRAGEIGHLQNAARILRQGWSSPNQASEQPAGRHPSPQSSRHSRLPSPVAPLCVVAPNR
jgi:hypothetical protein